MVYKEEYMMKTQKILLVVTLSVLIGSVAFGIAASGGKPEGKPFQAIWDAIDSLWYITNNLQDQIDNIEPGGGDDGDWVISDDDMYSAVPGNVGIGTTNPGNKLDVQDGGLTVDGGNTFSDISLNAGNAPTNGVGGKIDILAGIGYNNVGGGMTVQAGQSSSWSGWRASADTLVRGGKMESINSYAEIRVGGGKVIKGGWNDSDGGTLTLRGGDAADGWGTDHNGGHIVLDPGAATGSGAPGNVGIGTMSPNYPLEMGSGAHVTVGGVWTDASSREYKENIRDLTIEEAKTALEKLEPTKFNYKVDKEEEYIGFIAEDVPGLVASKDRKGLSPMDIVAVLTKVVQQQQKEIEELTALLNARQ